MKRGFTLVELLAVIVILAIILAIAIPSISAIIDNSKVSSYNNQIELLKRAAILYSAQTGNDGSNISVTLQQLIDNNLLSDNIKNPITGQNFDTSMTLIINRSNGSNEVQIQEAPFLATGMIPVYYDGTTGIWKKADATNANSQWYDYNTQKWANAVTVTSATRTAYQNAAAGTTINMSDINTMWVWIPRFKYKIPSGSGAREILVSFETKHTAISTGNTVTGYYTHPAFTFETSQLSGLWVGKFETTGTTSIPTILPDVVSLKFDPIKTYFDSLKTNMQGSNTYGFSNDNDIHITKNTEWGAVSFLAQSKYGKYGNTNYTGTNKEIYLNNSSSYYTGRSMGAPGGSGILTPTNEYIAAGYYTYDGKCASIHTNLPSPCNSGSIGQTLTDKTLAYGASTTGNIYGVYDMSGGGIEYAMGVYKPNPVPATGISDSSGYSSSTTNSQYDLLTINSKYYNQYLTNMTTTGYILGDGAKETPGWYNDYGATVNGNYPWVTRGGHNSEGAGAGIFQFSYSLGTYGSFHTVLVPLI